MNLLKKSFWNKEIDFLDVEDRLSLLNEEIECNYLHIENDFLRLDSFEQLDTISFAKRLKKKKKIFSNAEVKRYLRIVAPELDSFIVDSILSENQFTDWNSLVLFVMRLDAQHFFPFSDDDLIDFYSELKFVLSEDSFNEYLFSLKIKRYIRAKLNKKESIFLDKFNYSPVAYKKLMYIDLKHTIKDYHNLNTCHCGNKELVYLNQIENEQKRSNRIITLLN